MPVDQSSAVCRWSSALVESLSTKAFRDAYVEDHVRTGIAFQIRALREQQGWSQAELAKATNTTQSVISRLEDPDYGKIGLQSLFGIAAALDLPLLVQYVDWDDWLNRMADVSPASLKKRRFDASALRSATEAPNQSKSTNLPNRRVSSAMGGKRWSFSPLGNAGMASSNALSQPQGIQLSSSGNRAASFGSPQRASL